jgi:hypothetical protein
MHWQKALLWHGLGFVMLLVLTWCDALIDLTNYVRGLPPRSPDINEVAMKTVVIIFLWMGSAYKLYRIVSRLSYLEKFLHVCAWCRKIQHQDLWLSLEEHFQQKSGGAVSHGICPQCAERFKREAIGMSKGS